MSRPAQLGRNTWAWRRLSRWVQWRDRGVCQVPVGDVGICGAPSTCADHIIPRSRGGSDDPGNLRACCTFHNLAKWDRLTYLPRARTSRQWL